MKILSILSKITQLLGQLNDAGNTTTLAHYLELLDKAGMLCAFAFQENFRSWSISVRMHVFIAFGREVTVR